MPTNMFDEARRRVSSGTSASSSQNDNIFSQARSRVNTGQTVDAVPAKTQRSAASPLPTKKKNLERIDLGQNEGKIGEGWESRVNTEDLIGESYKDTTAYYDRLIEQKKKQFEAVKPGSDFMTDRQRLRYEIDSLQQQRDKIANSAKRGSFSKEGAGGFGSDSELHINPRSPMQTVSDTIARGAGQFDLGLLKTADFAANAIPRAVGAIRGVDPEETFTGQLFKPVTDATGQAVDWMQRGVDNMNRDIQNDTKDSKAAKIAAEVGSGVISALPNAALAMMTGGASAGGAIGSQLATQSTGLSGTILSAWNKMVSSPMFQVSFAQTLGNSYDEAKQAGASDMDAMAAALLSTTANAMVEAGGGIETLPGELSGEDLSSGKKALKWLTSALDEGKEEVVQGVISNMVNKAAGTDNRPYFSMKDENAVLNPYRMGQEFGVGAAIGGIMGGGQVLADTVMNRSKAKKSALDFAIEETLKPTQEQANLDRALEGLFEQNKAAQVDTRSKTAELHKITMEDFTNSESPVWNNVEYDDDQTKSAITRQVHDSMVNDGAIVTIPEQTKSTVSEYYPDMRGVKKQERTPVLKQKMAELKSELRRFLNSIKGNTYEFEVNGNILEAKLYDTGVREVMEKITQNKASMLLHSEEVFKNARYLYSTPDYDGDPNVYRWNYFYTPVQIGEETAGVRIAIRDLVTPQESQIYNWGIKNDAALGGGGRGKSRIPNGASSAAFDNNSIRGNSENVNGNTDQSDVMDHGSVGAAEIGFNPYSHFQNQTDNFLPEGANAARLVDMPAVDPTGKPVRRGAKTIYGAQTTSDARAEQMESEFMDGLYGYDPVKDKPTLEKAKQTIAQEGYDRAYARVTERLQSMKKLKETGLEAYLLYADAVKNGNDADAAELCLLLTQSGTEFAQGVQMFSMFRKLTPEGQLIGVERLVQRINDKYDGSNISIDENLIEEFRNATDQDSRDAVMEKIYQDIGQKIPTTFAEAANQWRYTAMLLNPSTHIKNMGGNLSMMAMKLGKDAVGTGIEVAANAITGGKVGRTKSILNVFSKSDQALMQKAWSDFENVQDDVAGIGKNKDNVMGKVGEYRSYWKLNDPQGSTAKLVDGVLRGAEKVPQFNSKLMEAEDMIFSRPDYAVSLAGYMKANKLTEITPEARAYAIKEAQKATFRDANAVSNFARKIGTGDHKFWNWVASAIFPFKGTPANVGVRAFEYSPAGLLKALTYDIYRVKTGKISATEYIDNLSSGLTGSALAAVGYFLAQAGFLRSTGVGDEKEKEQQRQQGFKDNSFILAGKSIPEKVLTSLSAPLFSGAAFYEALQSKALTGEIYGWDEVFQVLAATADPIFGQTMLDGLSDTFYAIRSAQGGIGETMAALGINTVGNYLSSFMPTLLSRISSAADSAGRETYVDKNKQMKDVQKEVQDLMMKSPARHLLHEKVDNYGRVQETWNPFDEKSALGKGLNFVANVVTPTYPSEINTTPVEDELKRLYRSGADTSDRKIFQTETPKAIKVDKKTVNLTQDQHEQFEKTRGKNTMEYQGALQENSTYEKLDDELKINATDKMYDFIEQTSKESLNIGYEPEQWVSDLKGKSKEEIADVIMLKTIESYVKSDIFSGKYDGITSMLESGKIDEAMAVSMLPKEAEDGYFNQIKGSGIEISTFIDVYQFKTDARSDYDKDGKTVKSAQEKVIEYINRVEKSPEKKRRLFLSMGYAESKIPEEWK